MIGQFVAQFSLFAQGAPAPANKQPEGGLLPILVMVGPLLLLYVIMMSMSTKTDKKKRQELLTKLKKNDRVLTTGGMYGVVTAVDPEADRIVLRVDDERGVKIAFSTSAILRVLDAGDKEKAKEPTAGAASAGKA